MLSTIQKNFRIPRNLNTRIKRYAEVVSISETDFFIQAIEEKLSRQKIEDHEIFRILKQLDKLNVNQIHDDLRCGAIDHNVTHNQINEVADQLKTLEQGQSLIIDWIKSLPKKSQETKPQTTTSTKKVEPSKANLGSCPHCNAPLVQYEKNKRYKTCLHFPSCNYYENM